MIRRVLLVTALIGAFVPAALAQLNSTDKAFVMKLAKSNNYEIKAAQMAQNMTTNDSYKTYAQMIVTDHTQAGQKLAQTLSSVDPSVQAPTDVSATDQAHLDTLKNAGNSFDVKYRAQMISTHVAAIKLVQNYVSQPNDNAQVKQFAEGLLPVFRKHLADAKKLPRK